MRKNSRDINFKDNFMKTVCIVLAAISIGVFAIIVSPGIVRASDPIKIGMLEDRSGNFALFGIPKHHGMLLAVKEINEGYTLAGGPTGPGGKGVFGNCAQKPPVQNVKDGIKDKGGTVKGAGVVFNDRDQILVKSGEKGLLGRKVVAIDPDPQSDNRRFQSLTNRLIMDEKVDVIMAGFACRA